MDDFSDQALLANVLRARDNAPMNFNDLSSITGALSLSSTLGFTLPFGPFVGPPAHTATSLGTYRNTGSPSFTGSTSPIINIGTLNTQGFMLTMIQPISSTYVLSKWNEGLDHRLLLYLFVKSIRFCDDENPNGPDAGCSDVDAPVGNAAPAVDEDTVCNHLSGQSRRRHINNPDDPEAMADFRQLVDCLFDSNHSAGGDVDLKSLLILDPLGNPVPAGLSRTSATSLGSQSNNSPPGTTYQIASDYNLFQTINGLSDGQLHAGNARCPFDADSQLCVGPDANTSYVQFYKEYPAQIVLCVNTDHDRFAGHVISPISEAAARKRAQGTAEVAALVRKKDRATTQTERDELQQKIEVWTNSLSSMYLNNAIGQSVVKSMKGPSIGNSTPSSSTTPTGGGGGGGGGGGQGGGANGGGSGGMSQVTMALIPSRISAIIPSRYCKKDQFVLSASTEEEFDSTTSGFAQVEWRSIAEVIQFLGAIARHPSNSGPYWNGHNVNEAKHYVFEIRKNSSGRISVDYGKDTYSAGWDYREDRSPNDPKQGDHTLQSLALLNELISIAKISGTLPVAQPVQVLP